MGHIHKVGNLFSINFFHEKNFLSHAFINR